MPSVKSLPHALILLLALINPSSAATTCPSSDNRVNLTVHTCQLVDSNHKIVERNMTYQKCGKERLRLGKPAPSFHNPAPALASCVPQQ